MITTCYDGTISVWNGNDLKAQTKGHDAPIKAVDYIESAGGAHRFASGGQDQQGIFFVKRKLSRPTREKFQNVFIIYNRLHYHLMGILQGSLRVTLYIIDVISLKPMQDDHALSFAVSLYFIVG